MTSKAVIIALAGTALLVFVVPYVLPSLGFSINGTETLLLVALCWATCWGVDRASARRRARTLTRP